jgi:hypothetical protein
MRAWMWLLGRDDLVEICDNGKYSQYGAPILAAICEALKWPIPDSEEAVNMIAGRSCHQGCEEGCDR